MQLVTPCAIELLAKMVVLSSSEVENNEISRFLLDW